MKRIQWKNHQLLGNLKLNFTNKNGVPYNTIILAGENGTGKTTILDSLASFLNLGSFEYFEFIEYEINGLSYKIRGMDQFKKDGFHIRENIETKETTKIFTNRNNSFEKLKEDNEDLRYYGLSYLKARLGFPTKLIQSTTTEQLDADKYELADNEDFTRIKQLLVDISSQDNAEWMKLCSDYNENICDDSFKRFKNSSRLSRFENAFNNFFGSSGLQFNGIEETSSKEKKIMFKKHEHYISVDNLSSGEKQIVFRGSYLLRNCENIKGGTVLIDEPELSMHPKWQEKILDYYRGLFTSNGKQSVQMIIATHSEYVIRSALKDSENVLIIALDDKDGMLDSRAITSPSVLPSITAAETNYLVFNIASNDYHIELYSYLQSIVNHVRNKNTSIKECDDFILQQLDNEPEFENTKDLYKKEYSHYKTIYKALPTYIRNVIDHPDNENGYKYNETELRNSIQLLIKLCKKNY